MAVFKGSATFTPAADEHAAGDVIGVKASLATVMEPGHYRINRITVRQAQATLYDADLRLHLFNAIPTTIADSAAFTVAAADRAAYLGYVDLGTMVDLVDTQFAQANPALHVDLSTGVFYGFLVSSETATPAAVAFTVNVLAEKL